jgi:hypothetical protein
MKRLFLIIFTLAIIGGNAPVSYAGFEEEFKKATDIELYRRGINDMETAFLIKNATGVLHSENLKILEKLEKIEERLSAMEEMIGGLK